MSNYWNTPGIPHKGWELIDVFDVREDGQAVEDTDYETCMMCNNERIRYVHILEHEDVPTQFRVGCICAEKMTNDYVTPRRLENSLKNKAERRKNWSNKDWKHSKNGNQYLKKDGHFLLIYHDKKTNQYKCAIDDNWGKKLFETLSQAKAAIFNGIEYFKAKNEW